MNSPPSPSDQMFVSRVKLTDGLDSASAMHGYADHYKLQLADLCHYCFAYATDEAEHRAVGLS